MTPAARALLRQVAPFMHLPRQVRQEYLRDHGMYTPARDCRVGCDAFEVRADVELGDAVDTAAELLRGVVAMLEVLQLERDIQQPHRDVCMACAILARHAGGALAVIAAAIGTDELTDGARPNGA